MANEDAGITLSILRYLPHAVAVLYVTGFIVTNGATAQVERIDLDLLQARYLSAGLLFLVLGGVPIAGGALWSSPSSSPQASPEATSTASPTKFDLFARSRGARLGLLAAYTLLWYLLLFQISVAVNYTLAAAFLCVAFIGGKQLRDVAELFRRRALGDAVISNHHLLFNTLNSTVLIVSMLGLFASVIYGAAKPEFGGGATWLVQAELKDSSLSSTIGQRPIAIVSETNERVQLVFCTDSISQHHVTVPLHSLGVLRTLRMRGGWPVHEVTDVRVPLSAQMCRFIFRHDLHADP